MQDKTIFVSVGDQRVSVDGIPHGCAVKEKPEIIALRWTPPDTGIIYKDDGSSEAFTDFSVIEKHLGPWKIAEAKRAKEEERKKIEAEKRAKAEAVAEQVAREAEERAVKMQPMIDAIYELQNTDHEVIKAMEKKLYDEGLLPHDLVQRRDEARHRVKIERPKFFKTEEGG
jgi:hypothetical protein